MLSAFDLNYLLDEDLLNGEHIKKFFGECSGRRWLPNADTPLPSPIAGGAAIGGECCGGSGGGIPNAGTLSPYPSAAAATGTTVGGESGGGGSWVPLQVPYYQLQQQQLQLEQQSVGSVEAAAESGYPLQVPYNQLLQQQHHHQKEQEQQQNLEAFWACQLKEINETNNFKNNKLPLAHVKRLMKDNEDVCKVSEETPMLMAKVCEMFIQELTLRSWFNTEENKRRMVQKKDVAKVIEQTELFDFLVDIVHKDEIREEGAGFGASMLGSTSSDVQNAHPPMGQTAPSEVMIRGTASSGKFELFWMLWVNLRVLYCTN
ncbi:Nuclear transcription factor Y subunit C-4 [Capsicum annuum]|uniref:Nuclear transcription factor Y subunit C-4 n=1 Tax=Capsicum annuum TaxID=4072 RepID=A0A2G3A0X9_CAPAN|nr:Nuclear transcription factor Y subunit C-4 [Capsicum annuum]